jgi:hypothetical protein
VQSVSVKLCGSVPDYASESVCLVPIKLFRLSDILSSKLPALALGLLIEELEEIIVPSHVVTAEFRVFGTYPKLYKGGKLSLLANCVHSISN